jgi:hypothetical protein
MAFPIVEEFMNIENQVLREELHEEEEVAAHSISLENQGRSVVVSEFNLSNFCANIIHDKLVLGF